MSSREKNDLSSFLFPSLLCGWDLGTAHNIIYYYFQFQFIERIYMDFSTDSSTRTPSIKIDIHHVFHKNNHPGDGKPKTILLATYFSLESVYILRCGQETPLGAWNNFCRCQDEQILVKKMCQRGELHLYRRPLRHLRRPLCHLRRPICHLGHKYYIF